MNNFKALLKITYFLFKADFVFEYLDRYRETLGIPYDADDNITGLYEMKLLRFFEYLYSVDKNIGAKCVEITSDKVLSFNTKEELENIKIFLNLYPFFDASFDGPFAILDIPSGKNNGFTP